MQNYITVEAPELIVETLKCFIEPGGFIAGGLMRDLMAAYFDETIEKTNNLKTKDIDIFFFNEEDFQKAKKHYEMNAYYSLNYNFGHATNFKPNNSPRTRRAGSSERYRLYGYRPIDSVALLSVDLVSKIYGSVEEILNGFDFTVSQCAFYWDKESNKYLITYSKNFENDLFNKNLSLADNSTNKIQANVMKRVLQYKEYGFTPDSIQQIEILNMFVNEHKELKQLLNKYNTNINVILLNDKDFYNKIIQHTGSYREDDEKHPSFSETHYLTRIAINYFYDYLGAGNLEEKHLVEKALEKVSINPKDYPYDDLNYFQKQAILLLDKELDNDSLTVQEVRDLFEFCYYYNLSYKNSQDFHKYSKEDRLSPKVICRRCSGSIAKCQGRHLEHFSVDDSETENIVKKRVTIINRSFHKIFRLNYEFEFLYKSLLMGFDNESQRVDKKWLRDTVDFWLNAKKEMTVAKLSLRQWHDVLENDLFVPNMPLSLFFNLAESC